MIINPFMPPTVTNVDGLQDVLDDKLDISLRGIANGIAELDSNGKIPLSRLPATLGQEIYTTTTATAEGWYRIATIPIETQYKQTTFRVKAYTSTGTTTESTIDVNLAYYSGSYSSQYSGITANTSHSYNSSTSSENGYVLLYCRVSFDATYGYIDLYKYKTTAVTIESQPLAINDWVWATGALTVNPTVGSYRNVQVSLSYGLNGNNITANYASSCSYSNNGVLGGNTLSNTTDKTGQWAYIGNVELAYNASYLSGRSLNMRVRIQEMSYDGTLDPSNMDDFCLNIRANLGYHADANAFNTIVPTFNIEVEGKTTLISDDICALVYSTSTTGKFIRFYIKLKNANTVYAISPEQRYGRAFSTSSYSTTTSYCYFSYVSDQTPIINLPTPAQGNIVNAIFRNNTLSVATESSLGGIKSGTDILVDANGNVSVVDDSHNHIISNVDGLQTALDGKLSSTLKGAASGVAELDSNGKVPSSQLPSFVDDVIEGTLATFPATGETGKIYVDTATGKTYRWSGSTYVVISETLALGETSSTAYAGDKGKIAYNHSQAAHAPSNATANDTDANLKNRANHTGTQSADTLVDGTTNKVFTATEKTKLTNAAIKLSGTATLASASWTGSSAPYVYTLTANGILSTDTPHIGCVTGADAAAGALIQTAFALLWNSGRNPVTSDNTITFYASAVPSVAIPIQWEVIR